MTKMNWRQFKEIVDALVEEETEIWYIDVSFPTVGDNDWDGLNVRVDPDCGLAVS